MNISYNWLKNYININKNPTELGKILTAAGLEVEAIETFESIKGGLQGLVIGKVLTCEQHPNADRLRCTTVDVGQENPLKIVCGAPNVAKGQTVGVALVGATLYPTSGESFTIKKSKIRGEESEGMICAEDEIGLGTSHEGIMVLETSLSVGTPLAKYFNIENDFIFVIGLTPNRADAASHIGVARDLAVLLNEKVIKPSIDNFKVDNHNLPFEVIIENKEACLRYSGVSISGVKVDNSPEWLQNRLKSIGLKPVNNIVDSTNFVLHELGQPLHAFDADKIKKNQLRIKTLSDSTKFVTLDNIERNLSANDLMICDGDGLPMCIAGVFGGKDSGISSNTVNIFLESAYFSPAFIRKTGQKHLLKTDASFRFERGTDINMTVFALKRVALLIQEIAGGKISSEIIDIYPEKINDFEVVLRYAQIDRILGKKLEKTTIKTILEGLEIKIINTTDEKLTLQIPPYRVDVQREIDVIEEIGRLYGYDNIEFGENLGSQFLSHFPKVSPHILQQKITAHLVGQGFIEMWNNSLAKPTYYENLESFKSENSIEILNKLSEDLGVMRQSLLFSGLEVIAHNVNRKQIDLKLFEIAKIYQKKEGEGLSKYKEETHLSMFLVGKINAETWRKTDKNVEFHDLSASVWSVLQKLNIKDVKTELIQNDIFAFGVNYMRGKNILATVGQVHKNILKKTDLKVNVLYADVHWDLLVKGYQEKVTYQEISKFPEVRRDLSLVLDKNITFQQVKELAFQKERKLLKQVNVFDVYEGENLGQNKKSYSVSFILEDTEATLNETTIEKVMQKLIESYEKELGGVIRK
ncbi:MAG: phenylalanine--tRNA ligase subunit beta [Cytophagia bacterium]|nr:MAG: phenylalanine--tRNA ligase subunit beta [Cytophagia bacterium]TAG43402.1 MAG: phenylalanine--tRNA ligase subunit beta [Cytophagia bacterium]